MPITLGKDCSISFGSISTGVRNVTLTESARTIEVNKFGSRYAGTYNTGYECTVSVELNNSTGIAGAFEKMHSGGTFTVSGGAAGFSFLAVMTSITETDPIDGVATFILEGRMADPALTR